MRIMQFEQQYKNPLAPPTENPVPITTQPVAPKKQADSQKKK